MRPSLSDVMIYPKPIPLTLTVTLTLTPTPTPTLTLTLTLTLTKPYRYLLSLSLSLSPNQDQEDPAELEDDLGDLPATILPSQPMNRLVRSNTTSTVYVQETMAHPDDKVRQRKERPLV